MTIDRLAAGVCAVVVLVYVYREMRSLIKEGHDRGIW
jgi:hypothetical protein